MRRAPFPFAVAALAILGAALAGCGGAAEKPAAVAPPAAAEAAAPTSFASPPPVGTPATCTVMGEAFVVAADTLRSEYQGRHYVFCCPGCKAAFDADPGKYAR